jgi:hypothetical protein
MLDCAVMNEKSMIEQNNQTKKMDITNKLKTTQNWIKLRKEYCIIYKSFINSPVCEGVFPLVIYVAKKEKRPVETAYRGFSSLKLRRPIKIPPQFKGLIKTIGKFIDTPYTGFSRKRKTVMIKIFLMDEAGLKKWNKELPEKTSFIELLNFIENIRVKDLHARFTDNPKKSRLSSELFPVINIINACSEDDLIIRLPRSSIMENARKHLIECNRLLKDKRLIENKKNFPISSLRKLNEIRDRILEEDLIEQGKKSEHPIWMQNVLRKTKIDAFDDFIYTLYRDFFKVILRNKEKFKDCKYKYCTRIFQRRKGLADRYWKGKKGKNDKNHCDRTCEQGANDNIRRPKHRRWNTKAGIFEINVKQIKYLNSLCKL